MQDYDGETEADFGHNISEQTGYSWNSKILNVCSSHRVLDVCMCCKKEYKKVALETANESNECQTLCYNIQIVRR